MAVTSRGNKSVKKWRNIVEVGGGWWRNIVEVEGGRSLSDSEFIIMLTIFWSLVLSIPPDLSDSYYYEAMAASSRTASRSTDISGVSAGGAGKKSGQRRGIEFERLRSRRW